jgi:signal transduction histidine kinase
MTVETSTPTSQTEPSRLGERPIWISAGILAVVLGVLVATTDGSFSATANQYWREALFWIVVVALVNLFPIRFQELSFTLDAPLTLAVAILYPPSLAAIVGLVATIDIREIRGQIDPSYALFNRLQTAITVFLAAITFHAVAGDIRSLPMAILGTLAALVVDYAANVVLVLAGCIERGGQLRSATRSMRVADPAMFFGTYLGYGLLAFLLAHLFETVGGWSVVAFLVPIVAAQQMLLRTQKLQALTTDLRKREQLMQSLIDSVLDERRDERQRIAGELHDSVLQQLIKLGMIATQLRKQLDPHSATYGDVEELVQVSDDSVLELRGLMEEIRKSPLGRGGLLPTLDGLVRDLRLEWQQKIFLSTPAEIEAPARAQVTAYQVAREGLTNALKHAEATAIWVHVDASVNSLLVEVQDDGIGFDLNARPSLHFGLRLLQERIEACGGTLSLESQRGNGTRLRAAIPSKERAGETALSGEGSMTSD